MKKFLNKLKSLFENIQEDKKISEIEKKIEELDYRISILEDDSNLLLNDSGLWEDDDDEEEEEYLPLVFDKTKKDFGKN